MFFNFVFFPSIFERVTKSCLEGMILHCNEEAAGKLQGYNDANTFMCEEGYPGLSTLHLLILLN